MVKEIWKDYTGEIKAFHGLIKVSNLGRVYKTGTNTSKHMSGILKCTKNNQGYVRIHVSINGKVYNKPVHRLVAEMFCSNPEHKPYVDHINAVRDDNRADNLRWVTSSENNMNLHYKRALSKRIKRQLAERGDWMAEALKKRVIAEGPNGEYCCFDSIKELKIAFHASPDLGLTHILHNDRPVRSKKSCFYGWYIHLADSEK